MASDLFRWDISRSERETHNYALLAAFLDPRFKNDAIWVQREKKMGADGFINLVTRFKLSGSGVHAAVSVESPPQAEASSGLLLRPQQPDADEDDDSMNDAKLAWKAWMKESITVPEGISCDCGVCRATLGCWPATVTAPAPTRLLRVCNCMRSSGASCLH